MPSRANRRLVRGGFAVLAFFLAACAVPVPKPDALPAAPVVPLPEDLLLDVGIRAFDVPASDAATAELRRAESAYLAVSLRTALQATDAWGAVRVTAQPSEAIDLAVVARVEQSDGETLALHLRATDARGTQWLDKRYQGVVDGAVYGQGHEPFAAIYAEIAEDLTRKLFATRHEELRSIRTVAELRFADSLAPGAFADYLQESSGVLATRRLPAAEDPLLGQVRQVLGRERLFIDTVDEYFTIFEQEVDRRYSDWRRSNLDSAVAQRDLLTEARARESLGAIHLLNGMAAGEAAASGNKWANSAKTLAGVLDGTSLFALAARNREAAAIAAEAARTEATQAGAEMLPATVTLENSATTLERRVAKQYVRATQALREFHMANTGTSLLAHPQRRPQHFAPIAEHTPPLGEGTGDGLPKPRDGALGAAPELPPMAASVDGELAAAVRLIESGRLNAAFGVLNRLVEAAESAAYNGRELAHIHGALAFAHYRSGDIENASAALETVVAHGTDISEARLADANFSLARLRFEQDEDALAWQAMRRGVAATGIHQAACMTLCSPDARAQVAAAVKSARDVDSASCEVKSNQVRRLRALDRRLWKDLDMVAGQIDAGEPEAALAAIDDLLRETSHGPEHALLWRYKAAAHSALGDMARAIQAYEKVLRGPDYVPRGAMGRTLYDLAHMHLAQGNHQRSLCYQRQWLHRTKFAQRVCRTACPKRGFELAARNRSEAER